MIIVRIIWSTPGVEWMMKYLFITPILFRSSWSTPRVKGMQEYLLVILQYYSRVIKVLQGLKGWSVSVSDKYLFITPILFRSSWNTPRVEGNGGVPVCITPILFKSNWSTPGGFRDDGVSVCYFNIIQEFWSTAGGWRDAGVPGEYRKLEWGRT